MTNNIWIRRISISRFFFKFIDKQFRKLVLYSLAIHPKLTRKQICQHYLNFLREKPILIIICNCRLNLDLPVGTMIVNLNDKNYSKLGLVIRLQNMKVRMFCTKGFSISLFYSSNKEGNFSRGAVFVELSENFQKAFITRMVYNYCIIIGISIY